VLPGETGRQELGDGVAGELNGSSYTPRAKHRPAGLLFWASAPALLASVGH